MSFRSIAFAFSVAALFPLCAAAQTEAPQYDFQPVAAPVAVSRGEVEIPTNQEAYFLDHDGACTMALTEWGWDSCSSIDAFIVFAVPGVDTTLIERPNSDGYVKLDDWNSSEKNDMVQAIASDLIRGTAAQGAAIGQTITFDGWLVEPTLNTEKNYLYYATKITWAGDPQINIKATVFDRRGYVPFSIIPDGIDISPAEVEALINATLDQYHPSQTEAYASFTSGDTVAAVGAVGVLAGLAGLQYGKGAVTGIAAFFAMLFKSKLAILLLAPFIWIKNLFRRKDRGPDV